MKKLTTILKRTAKLIPLWAIITGLLFFSALWGGGGLLAQTPVPGGGGSEGAPLDGFSAMLLAAGVGYGIHRMKKNKAEKEVEK